MPEKTAIHMALIGAGIFTRKAHIPAVEALGTDKIEVKVVYSRTEKSARVCAAEIPYPVEISTDMDAVLARQDIDAVDITLPIGMLPYAVGAALKSGKHVISEKPMATDLAVGRELIAYYRSIKNQVWMVAENYRYNDVFLKAASLVADGEIGVPLLANFLVHTAFDEKRKSYHTSWRRDDSFRGGMVMDAGVHIAAAIRMILGEIGQVNVYATKTRRDLPSFNTLCANLQFKRGLIGNMSLTYASEESRAFQFVICGEKGILDITKDQIEVVREGKTNVIKFNDVKDVQSELCAFALAVREGKAHRNQPEQALQDVAVIDALLRSAETGKAVIPERIFNNKIE